jgi:hypothetical protein
VISRGRWTTAWVLAHKYLLCRRRLCAYREFCFVAPIHLFCITPENMKSAILFSVATIAVQQVFGHSTFQELWVNGVDEIRARSLGLLQFADIVLCLPGLLCSPTTIEQPSHGCDKHRLEMQCQRIDRHRQQMHSGSRGNSNR